MVKHVKGWENGQSIKEWGKWENLGVHSFRGATTEDMNSYILPTKGSYPDHVIIHLK